MIDGWYSVDMPGLPPGWRLAHPSEALCYCLQVDRVPPSMNRTKGEHWSATSARKTAWQEDIGTALMVERVPKGRYDQAIAGASIRFARGANRRDAGNFREVVEKALGDALIFSGDPARPKKLRYIPDDDANHFWFTGVEFEREVGPERTLIVILFTIKED